ncbi:MAG: hypothetical protein AAFO80_05220 [Pseudomonadota bacterium]
MKDRYSGLAMPVGGHGTSTHEATVLAVGDVAQWQTSGNPVPASADLRFCNFVDLELEFLQLVCPEVILTPVVADQFDCADVALRLDTLGYTGSIRALGNGVPKPEMIEREIKALCPTLDFALVEIEAVARLS